MKKTKRMLAVVLTAIMVMAMAIPTLAAEEIPNASVQITGTTSDHTYEAYQIFYGDYASNGTTEVLSNIQWGDSITPTANITIDGVTKTAQNWVYDLAASKNYLYTPAGGTARKPATAAELAEAMRGMEKEDDVIAFADMFAKVTNGVKVTQKSHGDSVTIDLKDSVPHHTDAGHVSGKGTGYYLIKDQDNSLTGTDKAYTRYIVRVAGTVTNVQAKMSVPTVVKKVKENTLGSNGTDGKISDFNLGTGYNDTADYSMGDSISYELIGTLPSTYAGYKTYSYTFHDYLSKGLTYEMGSISVSVVTASGTYKLDRNESTGFSASIDAHMDTNPEYASDPTQPEKIENGSDLKVWISNVKNITSGYKMMDNGEFATTKTQITDINNGTKIVATYTAKLNENAVIGSTGNANKVYLEYSNNPNGEGTGKTTEDEVWVYTYQLDLLKQNAQETNGTHQKLEGAEFRLQSKAAGTATENKWAVVDENGKVTEWVTAEGSASILKTDANGSLIVTGLDKGAYELKETKAPDGYNLLAETVKFTITSTLTNGQNVTSAQTATPSVTVANSQDIAFAHTTTNVGAVGVTVNNRMGSQLPTTGGMGTKLFYLLGAAFVIFASVMLITRRRMRNARY